MDPTDLPTSWELVPATTFVVDSDKRDFSFPKDPYFSSTVPTDLNMAEDKEEDKSNNFIKQVQLVMKNPPAGTSYSGPVDGEMNPQLISSLKNLEMAVQARTGKPTIGTILNGISINQKAFLETIKSLSAEKEEVKKEEPKPEDKPVEEKSKEESNLPQESIREFQSFLSSPHPIIGAPYQGPIDGLPNNKLIAAAKATESAMANALNDKKILGMLWNDSKKTFNTSVEDLSQALNLIQNSKK